MPTLYIFNRATQYNGDDIQPGCFAKILYRITQLILTLPLLIYILLEIFHFGYASYIRSSSSSQDHGTYKDKDKCHSQAYKFPYLILVFCSSYIVFLIKSIHLEYKLIRYAWIGTPIQSQLRNPHISKLYEWKYSIYTLVKTWILSIGVAAIFYAQVYNRCINESRWNVDSFIILSCFVIALLGLECLLNLVTIIQFLQLPTKSQDQLQGQNEEPYFSSSSARSSQRMNFIKNLLNMSFHEKLEQMWQNRIKSVFKCASLFLSSGISPNSNQEESILDLDLNNLYKEVASIFVDYFEDAGTLDLVPSDIIAAFIALQLVQKQRTDSVTTTCRISRRDMAEAARFIHFASAIYQNFWITLLTHPLSAATYATSGYQTFINQKVIHGRIQEQEELDFEDHDNLEFPFITKQTTSSSILTTSHKLLHSQIQIVYAQFKNSLQETPYAIVLDHSTKCIILTIRGSVSLEDWITDVCEISPVSLENLARDYNFLNTLTNKKQYCHHGIKTRVEWILTDLQKHCILSILTSLYQNYNIRIIGHSLGAACAALLAIILHPSYETKLHALCFCPPGGFISWDLAILSRSFITSFVFGHDVVPRMSIQNIAQLRNDVLQLFGRIKVSKMKILQLYHIEQVLSEEIPKDSLYYEQLKRFYRIQYEIKQRRDVEDILLYPPGKIVYFKSHKAIINLEEKESHRLCQYCCLCCHCCCSKTQKQSNMIPTYVNNDYFHEIQVSPSMVSDHSLETITEEIQANVFGTFFENDQDIQEYLANNDDDFLD